MSPWTLATFDASNPVKLSSKRNWMSATTFCTLAKTGGSTAVPVCRFMFAGGQLNGNQYSNVVDILDASRCYNAASLDPNTCMQMGPSITMAIARGSLAVASFLGSGNVGGGAAMFAGGKTEVSNMPVTWATSDYYISASATSPILDLAWFNLSVPRFDLAGIGFDISGSGGKQQALFAGGTTSDRQTSNVVDSYLFGSAIPDMYDRPLHASNFYNISPGTPSKCRCPAPALSSASWEIATPLWRLEAHAQSGSQWTPTNPTQISNSFAAVPPTSTFSTFKALPPPTLRRRSWACCLSKMGAPAPFNR